MPLLGNSRARHFCERTTLSGKSLSIPTNAIAPGGRISLQVGSLGESEARTYLRLDLFGNYFADGSGILDVHSIAPAEMHNTFSRASNGGSKHFLLWQNATSGDSPTITFNDQKNVLEGAAKSGWTLAMGACDLDGDMLPEIYIANDLGPDVVLHNLSTPGHLRFQRLMGKRTFTTPASNVMGKDSFKGMGIDCGDLNQDGIPDLAVSNITSEFALEE